jgi:hypothetical protein
MTAQPTLATQAPADVWLRLLARVEQAAPRPFYLWILQNLMGSQRAASVVNHLRRSAVPSFVQSLGAQFTASIAPHLSDESITVIAEKCPLETIVAISHHLAARREHETMAKLVTRMEASRVTTFIAAFNDTDTIAHAMQFCQSEGLKRFAQAFSGVHAARLAEALERLGYHKVQAEMGRVMVPEYLATLLRGMPTEQIINFLRDAPPAQVGHVLVKLPADRRNSIGQALMDAKYSAR